MKKLLVLFLTVIFIVMSFSVPASADFGYGFEETAAEKIFNLYTDVLYTVFNEKDCLSLSGNTITFLKDCYIPGAIFDNIKEDITFDINGHNIDWGWTIFGDGNHTITIKDSVGTGRIGDQGYFDFGNIKVIIENIKCKGLGFKGTVNAVIKSGSFDGISISKGYNENDEPFLYVTKMYIGKDVVIAGETAWPCAGIYISSSFTGNPVEINGATISGKDDGDAIYADGVAKINIANGTKLTGGPDGGKDINVAEGSVIKYIENKPINVSEKGVKVTADSGVFPLNTAVKVTSLTSGDSYNKAKSALADMAKINVVDITATAGNEVVQPYGKVNAVFSIPDGFDINNTALYCINGGKAEKLTAALDKTAKTLTTTLTHFSVYAVAQKAVEVSSAPSSKPASSKPVTSVAPSSSSKVTVTSSKPVSSVAPSSSKTAVTSSAKPVVSATPSASSKVTATSSAKPVSSETPSSSKPVATSSTQSVTESVSSVPSSSEVEQVSEEQSSKAVESSKPTDETSSVDTVVKVDDDNNSGGFIIYIVVGVAVIAVVALAVVFILRKKKNDN